LTPWPHARWRISLSLTVAMMAVYFGFILPRRL
jgi:hypothetical protein